MALIQVDYHYIYFRNRIDKSVLLIEAIITVIGGANKELLLK
jgi:hypothetical protein